jgi:hypothetical protein
VVASTMDLLGWLRKHLEEADTDLLRSMVLGFVQALMAPKRMRCAGRRWVSAAKTGSTRVTATGLGGWTLGWALWSWPSRSCAKAATSRTGCWSRAGGLSGP